MKKQVFISYSGRDDFQGSLLQYAVERMLQEEHVVAWTFQRDQSRSEKEIAQSLKERVKESVASIFLVSPDTLDSGATQWMELAYAYAFDVKSFVLLHRLTFPDLKQRTTGVPPLLLSSQCNSAMDWKNVIEDIRSLIKEQLSNG
ncbi:MAG TPA: TIR domain-containing protein [Pyrinomonadaceae bacterium]|nr:TIR domain-containing protein [Pyrinomonadaceae bacterium]